MNSLWKNWTSILSKNSLLLVASMLLPTLGVSNSVIAAKRVYVSYSALELSISVASLEKYANKGVVNPELAIYQQYLQPKQFQELQKILRTPIKASPIVLSQFLYTPQGEFLLRRLAEVIQPKSTATKPGFSVLRTALIAATAEPEGLTLLNLLRKYPTNDIYINLTRSLAIAGELEKIIKETHQAIAVVTQKSQTEATTISHSVSVSQLPDLSHQGKIQSHKQTLKFFDSQRHRLLSTDVYLPQVQNSAPVIVISHGLGSDSSNFQYLATHLASYGFAVVVPNHPGSNAQKVRSLVNEQTNDVISAKEFYDQPLDVTFILNQLETHHQLKRRLNLQQVGVFGQSLGGYTALALAGAKINFEQLQKDCRLDLLHQTWNMSLLFQCQALTLQNSPGRNYTLQDPRVKAAIAVNPITSSIFGKAGLNQIKTPVMIVSSSEDTIAPALYEQILPFSWLTNSQKYLVMLVGGTHFTTIGNANPASQQVALPQDVVGDAPQAQRYMNMLSLPFWQTYIAGKSGYKPYLSAAYAKKISHQSLGLSIIQSLTTTEVTK